MLSDCSVLILGTHVATVLALSPEIVPPVHKDEGVLRLAPGSGLIQVTVPLDANADASSLQHTNTHFIPASRDLLSSLLLRFSQITESSGHSVRISRVSPAPPLPTPLGNLQFSSMF